MNSPSNPASRGDFVSVYGTGGGVTNPAGVDDAMWPLSPLASLTLPVSATIGGERWGANECHAIEHVADDHEHRKRQHNRRDCDSVGTRP